MVSAFRSRGRERRGRPVYLEPLGGQGDRRALRVDYACRTSTLSRRLTFINRVIITE